MKTIVINAISALRGGGQTYLINLLEHLPDADYKIIILAHTRNKHIFEKLESAKVTVYVASWASSSIVKRILWEKFALPKKLREWSADVFFAPGGVMTTRVPSGCTAVTALRNMLPFEKRERKRFPFFSYSRLKLWLLRYVFLKSYKMASKIIFISNYSKSVVKLLQPEIESKSTVIYHGLNRMFTNPVNSYDLPALLVKKQFYLYVSILDVYKAQKEVVAGWKKLVQQGFQYPLVLVGPKYSTYGDQVVSEIEKSGVGDKIIYLGEVEYFRLPGLYQAARGMIYASSCECCPNILLEKMASGRPVICSSYQPMPEFGQDAVLYFDPYKPEELVSAVETLEESEEVFEKYAVSAKRRSECFDWNDTACRTLNYLLDLD